MGEGFIVRKGGVAAEQTATPSILDFSTASATSIKFKLRNNDSVAATLVYRFGTLTGDGESISVAANTTTAEITFTVPTITTPTSLFVTANATGKVKSEVAEQEFPIFIVYTAATGGTTEEYDSGGKRFKSHTFTGDGTFTVTTVGDNIDDRNKVDFLVIAGGGGGGGTSTGAAFAGGAGGGSGGYRTSLGTTGGGASTQSRITVTAQAFSIDVGAGGNGGARNNDGVNGSASNALGVTTVGGGGGRNGNDFNQVGISGGSGGGASPRSDAVRNGGAGTTGEGFAGGQNPGVNNGGTPGGGGSSSIGVASAANTNGQNGGTGLDNLLRTGSNELRAGGGGGGALSSGTIGNGQAGGGNGGANQVSGQNATANTGSGGGGSGGTAGGSIDISGGNGAVGIVVIRYEIAPSV